MSQLLPTDFPIDPTVTSGTALSQVLNRFADAEHTSNAGATAPPNTTPGMLWLDTSAGGNGVLKLRDAPNTGWLSMFNSAVPPISSAGGTFTGTVSIAAVTPTLVLLKQPAGEARLVGANAVGQGRWELLLGDAAAEAGGNAGSNFYLRRYNDAGGLIDAPIAVERGGGFIHLNTATRLADGTVAAPSLAFSSDPATGLVRLAAGVLGVVAAGAEVVRYGAWAQFAKRVAVSGADPVLVLDRASTAVESSIFGNVAGSSRWRLTLGDATAESGGNVGSNLTLIRYTDAGAYVDAPLAISRATGVVTCLDGLGVFDGSWSVSQDAAWRYQQVLNAAWRWQFNKSTGDMEWNANGAIFRFGGAGTYMDAPGGFRIKNATGADGSQALWDNNAGIRLLTFAGGWGFKWIVSNGGLVWTCNGNDAVQVNGSGDLSLLLGEAHKPIAGPWLGPSDERIKENIADYAAGLAQVIALRPRSYTFKPGGEVDPTVTHYGLISQEAQAVMPELVLPVPVLPDPPPPEDADAIRERSAWSYMRPLLGASQTEGEPVDVLFLNPNALTYALVNAVRELNAKVDTYVAAHP